jgi:hypothetical protein
MKNNDYLAFFNIETRDQRTGEWVIVEHRVTPHPTKQVLWFNTIDWDRLIENHYKNRIESVSIARKMYRSGGNKSIRVYGNVVAGNTFCNICWLNGDWYDDPKKPIVDDSDFCI